MSKSSFEERLGPPVSGKKRSQMMETNLKWLLMALCLQEQRIGTVGSANATRIVEALEMLLWHDRDRCSSFLMHVPGRHQDVGKLLRDLRGNKELFNEQKSPRKVAIFSLTDKGREFGKQEIEFLPRQCSDRVAEEFARIVPSFARS